MQSASTHAIKSKGGGVLEFELGDIDHVFRHEWQITQGRGTPAILGNDFWAKHDAKFDFATRKIVLEVNGERKEVAFTVGDEDEKEEIVPVRSIQDLVVPPRSAYTVRGLPHSELKKPPRLRAQNTWWVAAMLEEQEEALCKQGEAARSEAEQAAKKREQQGHSAGGEWSQGAHVSEEEQEWQRLEEELRQQLGSGAAEGKTPRDTA